MSSGDAPETSVADYATPLSDSSDEELVARARQKDVAAFEELLSRHEERVYRLAMRFVRNETDAQEVLQETFLSAWRRLDQFAGKAPFASWLYRVAANAALMHLRARRRSSEVVTETGEEPADDGLQAAPVFGAGGDWSKRPDEQLQSKELRRHIQTAVNALPAPQRAVFLVRDVEGVSTEETAELLSLSVPAVKTRLHRARLVLREAISKYFETG